MAVRHFVDQEQALYARQPERDGSLGCHSGRGSQYVNIRYTERLAEAGIGPSEGSKGDSYDNALAETINGLYSDSSQTASAKLGRFIPPSAQSTWTSNQQL